MGKTERSNGMQCSQGFFRGEKPDVLQETRFIAEQTAAPCRATMEALHNLRLDSRAFETRSRPALARRYPRDFTFYLGNPFPRLFVCHYIGRMERKG